MRLFVQVAIFDSSNEIDEPHDILGPNGECAIAVRRNPLIHSSPQGRPMIRKLPLQWSMLMRYNRPS
jgi:hypothetical protein